MSPGPPPDARPASVTVVIPTLGGPSLRSSIEALNRGSVVPAEILACIPAADAQRAAGLAGANVKVIATDCRGQVAQRAVGFRRASHDHVMQLDDDVLVDARCVESLLGTLRRSGTRVAVGAALMDVATGQSVYRLPYKPGAVRRFYHWLMNGRAGYEPGKLDRSGSAFGVDPGSVRDVVFDVEWLAGGCVMHYRKNLVLEDFYPFQGKAYYEDVVHSWHLTRRGIALKVDSGALCWLETTDFASMGQLDYLKYLVINYRRRRYSMQLYSRWSVRTYLFYLINYLNYQRRKLNKTMASRRSQAGR